jgi:hypothetical protein
MVIALFDATGTAWDGKPYRNTYTWYMKLRDSSIIDVIAFFDSVESTTSGCVWRPLLRCTDEPPGWPAAGRDGSENDE